MSYYHDDDGSRLPIRIDTTSNGEFAPQPLSARAEHANALAHAQATDTARRLGRSRRNFLMSACGAASSLLAINRAWADTEPAGSFEVDPTAAFEPAAALEALGGKEFIFDIQNHHVNPNGPWRTPFHRFNFILRAFPQAACGDGFLDSVFGDVDCFDAQHYIKEVFLDSDTDMAVMSFVPSRKEAMPLTMEEGDETRKIIDAMDGSKRLLLHAPVNPHIDGELAMMPELLERWKISAWKTYTQWGPDGRGYWLDDEKVGIPFIEKARELGLRRICIHKGLPFPGMELPESRCRDIGVVAKRYPDVDFIVYHSGYDNAHQEGPYDPAADHWGVDSLVETLLENGLGPGSNVYAELGSTWRWLMRNPGQAAYALGKLFKYVGPDNVLWGTDSIWYGSPQDQIQAFRAFQIGEELQEKHGYPKITPELRAKVFGLNSARVYGVPLAEVEERAALDPIQQMRGRYTPERQPSFLTYGPKTRRDFLRFLRMNAGRPT